MIMELQNIFEIIWWKCLQAAFSIPRLKSILWFNVFSLLEHCDPANQAVKQNSIQILPITSKTKSLKIVLKCTCLGVQS